MSLRLARFEIVHTDAGWHARYRAHGNLRIVWTTESYVRRRAAVAAIEEIAGQPITSSPFADHPEVRWHTDYPLEVRDIDEREAA
jgi:uncharacterized protein YegP (UPF0339 family)